LPLRSAILSRRPCIGRDGILKMTPAHRPRLFAGTKRACGASRAAEPAT
jgi:hypothetical protein